MMKMKFLGVMFLANLLLTASSSFAAADSSADVTKFVSQLDKAPAVIIRVPINSLGEENSSATELRVHVGEAVTSDVAVMQAFESGVDTQSQPQISEKEIAKDSSTWGFYPYSYGYGWVNPYYYNYYTPTYYYSGSYYNYSAPSYYYNYYPSYNNWNSGYRYYYYPRYWY